MEATQSSTPTAGETSDLLTQLSPPTQPDGEPLLANSTHADAQNGGVLPNEPCRASPSHRDSSETLPQATQSSFVDSASLERVNAVAAVSHYRDNIRAILERMWRIFRRIVAQLAPSLDGTGSVGGERLFPAGPSQSPADLVGRKRSTQVSVAAIRDDEAQCSTAAELAGPSSSKATDSPSSGTEAEDRGLVVEVGGHFEVFRDQLAGQQAQAGPSEIPADSPVGTVLETLARLTALHPRRVRQRDEATIQVHSPRDLEVAGTSCYIEYRLTEQGAIAAASDATEHPRKDLESFRK
ncbi:hypothetical protein MTO96_025884 [Rhipicephalus appendiculatus]